MARTPPRHRRTARLAALLLAAWFLLAGGIGTSNAQDAEVEIWADSTRLAQGECTTVWWRLPAEPTEMHFGSATDGPVEWGEEVVAAFRDQGITGSLREGYLPMVCPEESVSIMVKALLSDGRAVSSAWVTIEVTGPPPSATRPYLVLTNAGRLEGRTSPGAWSTVTGWLDARYGVDRYEVLDFATDARTAGTLDPAAHRTVYRDWVARNGTPRYVIIMGGPQVVPFGDLGNPCTGCNNCDGTGMVYSDNDTVFTDDWYGDLDDDADHRPDVRVARVPDGADLDLIRAIFDATARTRPEGAARPAYSHGHELRPYVIEMANRLVDRDADLISWGWNPRLTPTPDDIRNTLTINQDADLVYFILHGSKNDTSFWMGEDPDGDDTWSHDDRFPVAITADGARTSGLVVSEACYGAYLDGLQSSANSVALAFLDVGAFGLIGSTAVTYSSVNPFGNATWKHCDANGQCRSITLQQGDPLDRGVGAFSWDVLDRVKAGTHPLDALFEVKQAYPAWDKPTCGEKKALHSFVYYGLPPAGA